MMINPHQDAENEVEDHPRADPVSFPKSRAWEVDRREDERDGGEEKARFLVRN